MTGGDIPANPSVLNTNVKRTWPGVSAANTADGTLKSTSSKVYDCWVCITT